MSAPRQHAFLNTRISIMATKLLAPGVAEEFKESSAQELGKRFGFGALVEEGGIAIRQKNRAIQQGLLHILLAELIVLIRPMSAMERKLVLHWARKFALFNLKAVIRGKLNKLENREIRENIFQLPAILSLPEEELFGAENVLELLRQLEGGSLRLIARQAREVFEQRRESFPLESAIDRLYFSALAHQAREIEAADQEPLRQVLGALLDQTALLWLLRFRFSYRLSPSETFFQLVPSLHLLHRERLLYLANLDSPESLLEALPEPLAGLMSGKPDIDVIQWRLNRYLAGRAHQVLRHTSSGVARTLAYLILREMDLQLVFTLLQGKLLGLRADLIATAVGSPRPVVA